MLNLLRKNWRPSNQPDAGPSNVGSSYESQDPSPSDTRKRGINSDEDDPSQSAKRAKFNHSPSGTSEGDLDFNGDKDPRLQFPIPVFRFEAHQTSTTPVASAHISHAIVQAAIERNTILAVEDTQPPMEIYIPVLQNSKIVSTSRNQSQVSLVITADTGHATTQARIISIASKSVGFRSHITLQTLMDLPGDEDSIKQELGNAMERDVIFLSPAVLETLLSRKLLHLTQFAHLVLLDDVNNMREDHAVAKALLQHYSLLDESQRPHLLSFLCGGRSSTTYNSSLFLVEELLFSKIYGLPDAARNAQIARLAKPDDIFVLYDAEIITNPSLSMAALYRVDRNERYFRREFAASKYLRKDLGEAGAKLFWKQYLRDVVEPILPSEIKIGKKRPRDMAQPPDLPPLNTLSDLWRLLKNMDQPKIDMDRSSQSFSVTSKFLKLCQVLATFEAEGDAFRGIILVERDLTASMVTSMLQLTSLNFLRVRYITSSGPNTDPEDTDNTRNSKMLEEFRNGAINLLVTTSVGEDLLDLSPATCVIRWDVPRNFISYCHSKAKAHPKRSRFIILFEKGNDNHRRIAYSLRSIPPAWKKWIKHLHGEVRHAPPGTLNGEAFSPADRSEYVETPEDQEGIIDGVTGSKLTSSHALEAIYRFASTSLKEVQDTFAIPPLLECRRSENGSARFSCVVNLSRTPLGTIFGPWCRFQADARRLACYQACQELHRLRLLGSSLFPPPPPLSPAKVMVALDIPKGGPKAFSAGSVPPPVQQYVFAKRQIEFWGRSLSSHVSSRFYPTVVTLCTNAPSELDEVSHPLWSGPFQSICILARCPLPEFPSFQLRFVELTRTVHLKRCAALDLDDSEIQEIQSFSTEFCRTITGRNLVMASVQSPCLFLPLNPKWNEDHPSEETPWPFPSVSQYISWKDIRRVARMDDLPFDLEEEKPVSEWDTLLADTVFQEQRGSTSALYFGIRLRPDLNPRSKIPGQSVEADYENLLECHNALWQNFPGVTDENQPLIETIALPRNLNLFQRISPENAIKDLRHYCIPELTSVYPLSGGILRTGLACPSIMWRINDLLLSKELNALTFRNRIDDSLLLQALTPNSALMEHNYQRLEFFGDSFLKHMSSIYVIVLDPEAQEEQLHLRRAGIVQNTTLQRAATTCGLPEYILSRAFSSKHWTPPGYSVQARRQSHGPSQGAHESEAELPTAAGSSPAHDEAGAAENDDSDIDLEQLLVSELTGEVDRKGRILSQNDRNAHWLAPKRVADVVESVIGAAYLSGGDEMGLMACKAIRLPIPNVSRWSDFARKVTIPSPNEAYPIKQEHVDEIERTIGFKFSRPELLQLALTHKSATASHSETYERFEFLGDGVLEFLTVQYLYDKYPDLGPGKLTALKSSLVSLGPLSAICVESGLAKHLIYGSTDLRRKIDAFEAALNAARVVAEERAKESEQPPKEYWSGLSAPKELSDLVEALLGALLMSEDFDSRGARAMFDNVLKPFFDRFGRPDSTGDHPSNALSVVFQKRKCEGFRNSIQENMNRGVKTYTRSVVIHDVVLVELDGPDAAATSFTAAQMALDALEGDPGFLSVCDCMERIAERRQTAHANKYERRNTARMAEERDVAEVDVADMNGDFGQCCFNDERTSFRRNSRC